MHIKLLLFFDRYQFDILLNVILFPEAVSTYKAAFKKSSLCHQNIKLHFCNRKKLKE